MARSFCTKIAQFFVRKPRDFCVENFENSQWPDRLFCYHASLQEFTEENDDKYDLIVSNPPFFQDSYKTNDEPRNRARFTSSLSFEELIASTSKLISDNGIFSLVIPFEEQDKVVKLANAKNLFVTRICHVKGSPTSAIKRSFLEFAFYKKKINREQLIIETSRHNYTQDYINLVKNFYLKM